MKVIKGKTGCICHNCDNAESEFTISNNGSFKVYFANSNEDCEIAFCEDCARELFRQLGHALNM